MEICNRRTTCRACCVLTKYKLTLWASEYGNRGARNQWQSGKIVHRVWTRTTGGVFRKVFLQAGWYRQPSLGNSNNFQLISPSQLARRSTSSPRRQADQWSCQFHFWAWWHSELACGVVSIKAVFHFHPTTFGQENLKLPEPLSWRWCAKPVSQERTNLFLFLYKTGGRFVAYDDEGSVWKLARKISCKSSTESNGFAGWFIADLDRCRLLHHQPYPVESAVELFHSKRRLKTMPQIRIWRWRRDMQTDGFA